MPPRSDEPARTLSGRLIARQPERSPVEKANDQALEHAIWLARWVGAFVVWAAFVALIAGIWTADPRWYWSAVVAALVGGAAAWWGWWIKGNEEWRSG